MQVVITLDEHVSSVVASSFFQLSSLSKIKHFFCLKSLETVINIFITSRLNYCNSLLYGISKSQVARLQLVQNAAAKCLKNGHKYCMTTPPPSFCEPSIGFQYTSKFFYLCINANKIFLQNTCLTYGVPITLLEV